MFTLHTATDSARIAEQIRDEIEKQKNKENFEACRNVINGAVSRGKFECNFRGTLNDKCMDILLEHGYDVQMNGSEYGDALYTISWCKQNK
jgi:hypothetical protein